MAQIISKRDGPRREDVAARRLIENHRTTIEGIVNQLTGDAGRPGLVPKAPPEGARKARVSLSRAGVRSAPEPYVRISPNGRIVIADLATGRQLEFLGEIRGGAMARRFVLARRENGFFAGLPAGMLDRLADLDGRALPDAAAEQALSLDIARRLSIVGQE